MDAPPIDLRSDTVTRPTPAMRRAMAEADVGDDCYGEDPTVRALEEEAAAVLGKAAALFVPSGTMGNQLALLLQCRPGEEVIAGEGAHIATLEAGAASALAGVQFRYVGRGGLFTAADVDEAATLAPTWDARMSVVTVESTHNRAGGRLFPRAALDAIGAVAARHRLHVHFDGARIWNAAAATGIDEATHAACARTVSACFSKGLGAPVGSVLAGPAEMMDDARWWRRRLGGAMRQAGVIAAGALHALRHHRARLAEDHARARRLGDRLEEAGYAVAPVETNIVLLDLDGPARSFVDRAAAHGVLLGAFGAQRVRLVTHLDLDDGAIDRAADTLARLAVR
jgi:threonine aldolase